jgi:hypothetical protein
LAAFALALLAFGICTSEVGALVLGHHALIGLSVSNDMRPI